MEETDGWVIWDGDSKGVGLAHLDQVKSEAGERLRRADSFLLVSVSAAAVESGAEAVEPDVTVGCYRIPREPFVAAALMTVARIAGLVADEEKDE